jgi:hypothetical protein
MALSIAQTPASASLAQSPIIFSISESVTSEISNTAFQYVADLYYWTGSLTNSSSVSEYTMVKYPNVSLYGIFDLNRIINSTLTDLAQVNTSNVVYFACDFFTQYTSGSIFVTGSHLKSDTYKALDGYGIFQEQIGQPIFSSSVFWPLMTDGPVTQSAFTVNKGVTGVYVGSAGTTQPNRLKYTSATQTAFITLSGSESSSQQVQTYPIGPAESGFPLSGSFTSYKIQAQDTATDLGQAITYNIVCEQKYPNVRIKWKNRYGQFDWFNFNMVSRQSFNTERRTYQPQLGTWGSSTLSYQPYNSSTLNYISDSKQALSVQTDWVSQDYNEIFKQLLVTDEAYWIYDEANGDIRPITISTDSITFKTGVNDKVIQYGFDFNFGQQYKLII